MYESMINFIVFLFISPFVVSYCQNKNFFNCVLTPNICPNVNISFFLYTRNIQHQPYRLDMTNENTIHSAPFISGRPIIVIIHGYTGNKDLSPNIELRPAYFKNNDYNIISLDYNPLAKEPCYVQAVQNLPIVSRCTAQLLDFLIEKRKTINEKITLNDIHVIGFSLGAQVAGMISNYMVTGKIKRITGLDPAKPLFIFAAENHRLDENDAEFVDVIHTDILARGVAHPSGHVDFYVNGGIEQPGCSIQKNESTGSCNHVRAPQYYAESINSDRGFWGFKCKGWVNWAFGTCTPTTSNELVIMGERAPTDARGLFFVYTNKEPPYAEGILPEFIFYDEVVSIENITTEIVRMNK